MVCRLDAENCTLTSHASLSPAGIFLEGSSQIPSGKSGFHLKWRIPVFPQPSKVQQTLYSELNFVRVRGLFDLQVPLAINSARMPTRLRWN